MSQIPDTCTVNPPSLMPMSIHVIHNASHLVTVKENSYRHRRVCKRRKEYNAPEVRPKPR